MNEYEITFRAQILGTLIAYVYGNNEKEARSNLALQGIPEYRIVNVKFNEKYRGYGHI